VPNDLDDQLAKTAAQIEERIRAGDKLRVPRPIDHLAYFHLKRDAIAAAGALKNLGYEPSVRRRRLRVVLHAVRTNKVDADTAASFVREVFDVVAENHGDYEGWGAIVAT
jgi:Regulator of ribonuclease activity B